MSAGAEIIPWLRERFAARGLHMLGIIHPGPVRSYGNMVSWLQAEKHAGMKYLESHGTIRADASRLAPGARSVISFALPYPGRERHLPAGQPPRPRIARYARMRDYHRTMKRAGAEVLAELQQRSGLAGSADRVTVDSAPVMERALAAESAQGFIGKNTLYIHPTLGSFLLLGEIFTEVPLEPDRPAAIDPRQRNPAGGCGTCRRCQVHCPTGALGSDWQLDARLCLSYWTIEHRGPIPEKFWPPMAYYYFGCDICQLVCPWNRGPTRRAGPTDDGPGPDLLDVATMDQARYEALFGGTPLTRARITGLKRNALIALAVRREADLPAALDHGRQSGFPVVRQTVQQILASPWAP